MEGGRKSEWCEWHTPLVMFKKAATAPSVGNSGGSLLNGTCIISTQLLSHKNRKVPVSNKKRTSRVEGRHFVVDFSMVN